MLILRTNNGEVIFKGFLKVKHKIIDVPFFPMFENELETFDSDIGSQMIVVRRANIRFAPYSFLFRFTQYLV
jgi:hypothetical protein